MATIENKNKTLAENTKRFARSTFFEKGKLKEASKVSEYNLGSKTHKLFTPGEYSARLSKVKTGLCSLQGLSTPTHAHANSVWDCWSATKNDSIAAKLLR